MNILITGAAGFLGSNLSERLLAEGHKVWGVDNLLTGSEDNVERLQENPNFKFFKCGIEEQSFVDFCESEGVKFDRIYNLACATGVPNIQILADEMLQTCSVGTRNVLEMAKKNNSRFLFTSSSEIYGEPLVTPQGEDYTGNVDTLGIRANYEEGKRFSETLVAHYARNGVHAVMVRLFNAYGPNMAIRDQRVIPRFVTQAIKGEPLTVQGDGSQRRTLCFVTDILDGFEAVITKGIPGQAYNLGSDQEVTIKQFADKVLELSGSKSELSYVERPSHDHSARMPILDKIHALGWSQKVDLDTGLSQTIENFRTRLANNLN